jgi:hypothetical protein
MKNAKLIIILVVIVVFATIGTFLISKFSSPNAVPQPQLNTQPTTTPFCQPNQLSGNIDTQAAAGNIYATLTLTNIGKTACEIALGDTISARFDAKNIAVHYEDTTHSNKMILSPTKSVYSQVHFPNGPQCQSGIIQKPLTLTYKAGQTSIEFKSTNGKLMVQACSSESEKTIIDIWPLSQKPITQ